MWTEKGCVPEPEGPVEGPQRPIDAQAAHVSLHRSTSFSRCPELVGFSILFHVALSC